MGQDVAASTDTSAGPACSTRIAISGNAPNPNPEPYALTAYAAQSHPNCRPSGRRLPAMPASLSRLATPGYRGTWTPAWAQR